MEERIIFENSKGNKLVGILSKARDDGPLVILCHGLNSGKDSNTNIALNEVFLENNISSFRFDFFAHRDSEGEMEDRSVSEFVDNIMKAIEFVKSKGYGPLGLCGESFGGVASPIAASKVLI